MKSYFIFSVQMQNLGDRPMIKTFQILIPLCFEESFELICRSGDEIASWKTNSADAANGYIDWKQSFWALTGNTLIAAQLVRKQENKTSVTISVHKPLQVFDPAGICRRVFNKLLKSMERNLTSSDKHKKAKIEVV